MSPRKILIAETCPENVEALTQLFTSEHVRVVERGDELLQEVSTDTTPPTLILLAASLPDIDGCEICRRLKASELSMGIPVIFITSKEGAEEPEKFFEAGGADYLASPIHPGTARARIVTHLTLNDRNRELDEMKLRFQPFLLERELSEESLRGYVQRLQALIEMAGEGVTLSDERGFFEFYNSKMQELTGYSKDEANSSDDFLALLHPELTERYAALFAMHEIKASGSSRNLETTIHSKDGTVKTLLVSTSMLFDRRRPWFLSIYHDITERKAMERALRENEARFRSFAEHSLDVIMRFDRKHRHLYVNPIVEQQTGIPLEEFIGNTHAELGFSEKLVSLLDEALETVFVSGSPLRIEFEFPEASWFDWLVIPEVAASNGEVETVVTAARDITQIKQDEAELLRREVNLSTLVDIQQQLLTPNSTEENFGPILGKLGQISKVSRAYLFENSLDPEKGMVMDLTAEWCAPGIPSHIENPLLQHLPYDNFSSWREKLDDGKFVCTSVKELSEQEREFFEQQDVFSFLILPLMVHGEFFGLIGFDDCTGIRQWAQKDISLLQAAAAAISLAKETHQARQDLEDSHDRFAAVMNGVDSLIYVADMKSHELLFINEYTRKVLGDIEGEICWKALQKDQTGPCLFCTNEKLIENGIPGAPYCWEFQNTINNHWYYLQDQAISWTDGRLVRLEVATDITEFKHAEQALRESQALFQSAFDKSGVGMIMVDIGSMQILEANPAFCADVGYTREEVLGVSVFDLTHPDDREIGKLEIQEIREGTRETFQIEKRYFHKNGTVLWMLISAAAVNDLQGQPRYFLTHVQNITERKLAEAQAKQQRRIAESLRESALVLNSSLDRDTVLEKILEQLGKVVQCDSAAIFLVNNGDLVIVKALGKAREYLGRRIDMADADPVVSIIRHKIPHIIPNVDLDPAWTRWSGDAGRRIKSWMGAPLLFGEQVIGVLTTDSFQLNSYTEEEVQILQSFANHAAVAIYNARLFDEALQARKEAEVANQAKSEFLGRVSHELRTPLHIIMGMTYIAQEGELTQKQHKCLKDVQKASKKLLRLINEILDFSKLETGKIRVEHRLFRVDELLTNLLSRHQKHVERELLTLALRVEGNVPYALLGDPAHLEQVLDNLLDNAVKFTRDGEIVLSVSRMEDAEAAADRIILCFSLSDTGIGIAPGQIGGIFAPFHQVDGSNTRTYGGTGLGLTLCRRLVEMMGGEIRAESILGQGSTVTFTLPFGEHKGPTLVELAQPACMPLEEKNSLADETRSVSTPWGSALIPLLDHLVELLNDGDMEAEEYAASLETHFQGTPFEEKIREVLNLIAVYNFEKALVVLQGLIGVLEQTTFPSSGGKCYSRNDVR